MVPNDPPRVTAARGNHTHTVQCLRYYRRERNEAIADAAAMHHNAMCVVDQFLTEGMPLDDAAQIMHTTPQNLSKALHIWRLDNPTPETRITDDLLDIIIRRGPHQ